MREPHICISPRNRQGKVKVELIIGGQVIMARRVRLALWALAAEGMMLRCAVMAAELQRCHEQ